ncbi:hypothetical protein AVDCRST_MAG82-206, partial [uncultured Rubrobacteraceae bacterium]
CRSSPGSPKSSSSRSWSARRSGWSRANTSCGGRHPSGLLRPARRQDRVDEKGGHSRGPHA